ncbi:glycosyltransferase [Vibrio natriegens]|uniref:glycosyltransferase n=1 Tax=Vibrio natriegens TaxID=691 RepID=UPI003F852E76
MSKTILEVLKHRKELVLIHYFPHSKLIYRICNLDRTILDVRTLAVYGDEKSRVKFNNRLKSTCEKFKNVNIISEGVSDKLRLYGPNIQIVGLGADVITENTKIFKDINLLYVGTLTKRNIIESVKGFHKFQQNNSHLKVTYDIVGDGQEFSTIKQYIESNKLSQIVFLHGRVKHENLKPFFDKCNIGVSFVPMTEYFDKQPPTKTYEYILSGLPCIATDTFENRRVINSDNGVLCEDNSTSFEFALSNIVNKFDDYESDKIRNTLADRNWIDIVQNQLLPVLSRLE